MENKFARVRTFISQNPTQVLLTTAVVTAIGTAYMVGKVRGSQEVINRLLEAAVRDGHLR